MAARAFGSVLLLGKSTRRPSSRASMSSMARTASSDLRKPPAKARSNAPWGFATGNPRLLLSDIGIYRQESLF